MCYSSLSMPSSSAVDQPPNAQDDTDTDPIHQSTHETVAFLASQKDSEANHSAAEKEQRWPLLTSMCKVIGIECKSVVLAAVAQISQCKCPCYA